MQSSATTVDAYLAELPEDRRQTIAAIRKVILANLDKQYEEGMQYGHIGYYVSHKVFPPGYHCDPKQPLPYIGLASQKNHIGIYMMGTYCGCFEGGSDETAESKWFRAAWQKAGKKLDMGKACVRIKKLDDVPLDVLGAAVKRVPAKTYIARYEQVMEKIALEKAARAAARKATKAAAKK